MTADNDANLFLVRSTTDSASSLFGPKGGKDLSVMTSGKLNIATWNIAAINNNPFEYWITYKENPAYEELMVNIEKFLEDPGDKDVAVSQVFTEEMFAKLDETMTNTAKWKSVKSYWDNEFKDRKIISQFMKVRYNLLALHCCCLLSGLLG